MKFIIFEKPKMLIFFKNLYLKSFIAASVIRSRCPAFYRIERFIAMFAK